MQDERRLTQFGIAAVLPGIQLALDTLQKLLDEYRAQVASLEQSIMTVPAATGSMVDVQTAFRRGRSVKVKPAKDEQVPAEKRRSVQIKNYWAKLTPEQRKKEMARRQKVAKGEARSKATSTSGKNRAKKVAAEQQTRKGKKPDISAQMRNAWAVLTPAQHKARVRKMQAARRTKKQLAIEAAA